MQVLHLYIGVINIIFMNECGRLFGPTDPWVRVGQDNLQLPPQQYSPRPPPARPVETSNECCDCI